MIPGKASSTALLIAASTVFLRQQKGGEHLVSREAAEFCAQFLRAAGSTTDRILRLTKRPWFRRAVCMLESVTIPGIQLHYALRKRYIREWVVRNLREGYEQVVEIGAGFDTLCLELEGLVPGAQFIEIDHPATQRVKLRALAAMNATRVNVSFVAADLASTTLPQALASCPRHDPRKKTLFVAEGLLMYLQVGSVAALLDPVTRGPHRVAFTFLEPRRGGKPNFRVPSRMVDQWLKLRGERFRWGVRREEIGGFLSSCGLRLLDVTGDATFASLYPDITAVAGGAPSVGEYVCTAEGRAE